ncbi:MAG TPA: NAD-dependent epimerase/dehydratase family protein [Gemmatimonadota bacterium]|nr:NAD-dependent epimerase/dehydratase family protein [Gemmatimonadota bacterium]
MRIFLTGASGYIGSAVTRELVEGGHEVTGMFHAADSEERVRSLGAKAVRGELTDPATYAEIAGEQEALIHLAFDRGRPVEADRAALDTLIEAGRTHYIEDAHVIYTSGCWVLGDTGDAAADEDAPTDHPAEVVAWRPAHEQWLLGMTGEGAGLTATVVRPGMVYGGAGGLVSSLFSSAAEEGAARYVGDGRNRWSLVHRDDLAVLYRRIVEERAGGIFHGVDGEPTEVLEVARAASEAAGAGGETRSVTVDEARGSLGSIADALVLDQTLVTRRAEEIGWRPRHPSFVQSAGPAWQELRSTSPGAGGG